MKLIKYNTPKIVMKGSSIDPNYDFVSVVDTETQTDLSNIINIGAIGLRTGRDFLFVRSELLTLLTAAGGFSALTADEKLVMVAHSLATEADSLTVVSEDKYNNGVDNYLMQAKASRAIRVERARQKFGREIVKGALTYDDSNQFFTDSKSILEDWVVAYNPAFTDWITSTGTAVGAGFAEKPYFTAERLAYLTDHIIEGKL